MTRIITVTDQGLGIEARIHTDTSEAGDTRITKLELSSLGEHAIRSTDLLIFQELGLGLPHPDGPTVAAVVPASRTEPQPVTPSPTKAKSAPKRATVPHHVGKGGRTYYQMPPTQELIALYFDLGGPTAVARRYNVPSATAVRWYRRLRNQGHDLPTRRSPHLDTQPALPTPPSGDPSCD